MTPLTMSTPLDVDKNRLSSLTSKYDDVLTFYLNGTKVVLDGLDPDITLLEYIRGIGLTGTKL
jgi:xanthine dehydrogenase/oxidase